MPLDGVLFGLHGAMVAHGYDDVEGDVLERARAIVGPDCVIGVELDPHCHLTVKRVRLADITILYKEFPHTDVVERAEDLLTLVLRTIRKEIRPTTSLFDCRQIGSYPTTLPLMRGFVDRTAAMEGKDGVLSVSIGHCFPYADVPELDRSHPGDHRQRQGEGGPSGERDRRGVRRHARPHRAGLSAIAMQASAPRWRSTAVRL